jgi:hypothetical protein
MPTWCYNRLLITGRDNEVDQCLNSVKGANGAFDFNAVIPFPGPDPETLAGRNWRIRNWKTKWNACPWEDEKSIGIERTPDGGACFSFCTAWGPPIPVIEELSRKFPKLEFRLQHGGPELEYSGITTIQAGDTIFSGAARYGDDLRLNEVEWSLLRSVAA